MDIPTGTLAKTLLLLSFRCWLSPRDDPAQSPSCHSASQPGTPHPRSHFTSLRVCQFLERGTSRLQSPQHNGDRALARSGSENSTDTTRRSTAQTPSSVHRALCHQEQTRQKPWGAERLALRSCLPAQPRTPASEEDSPLGPQSAQSCLPAF